MEPRIALLDASHNDPTTPRNFRREIDGKLRRFSVVDREFPEIDGFETTGAGGFDAVCSRITDAQYEAAKPAKAVFKNFLKAIRTERLVAAD